jgi:hypothetical protein
MLWRFSNEPLEGSLIGEVQDGLPARNELHRLGRSGPLPQSATASLNDGAAGYTKGEILTEPACILDGAETVRVIRPIVHSLQVGFRERVVIGTCGRLCVLTTPRSASRRASDFEVIEEPRRHGW